MNRADRNSPIVAGGVGGSGTRVVAEILRLAGIYIGNSLNGSLDNLWFTFLFKRRDLFEKPDNHRREEIIEGLNIFTEAMLGGTGFSENFRDRTCNYIDNIRSGAYYEDELEIYFEDRLDFIENILSSKKPAPGEFIGWGWKEPNSHIFLEDLVHYFSNMKYIHLIRHGLDMAYSRNLIQAKMWGPMFGVQYRNGDPDPRAAFRYWLTANQRAVRLGESLLGGRFMVIKYEALCNSPATGIREMMRFLNLPVSDEMLDSMSRILSPLSIGRYKNLDTSWVSESDIEQLNMLGYEY